ncbi:hypothetical protein L1887_63279 [Cichorium endivia]|nr:hypothetical protein L1887_63279 [Cichorium endivia]
MPLPRPVKQRPVRVEIPDDDVPDNMRSKPWSPEPASDEPRQKPARHTSNASKPVRRGSVPEKSPLQKLEYQLDDISKEEKRARMKEAEDKARRREQRRSGLPGEGDLLRSGTMRGEKGRVVSDGSRRPSQKDAREVMARHASAGGAPNPGAQNGAAKMRQAQTALRSGSPDQEDQSVDDYDAHGRVPDTRAYGGEQRRAARQRNDSSFIPNEPKSKPERSRSDNYSYTRDAAITGAGATAAITAAERGKAAHDRRKNNPPVDSAAPSRGTSQDYSGNIGRSNSNKLQKRQTQQPTEWRGKGENYFNGPQDQPRGAAIQHGGKPVLQDMRVGGGARQDREAAERHLGADPVPRNSVRTGPNNPVQYSVPPQTAAGQQAREQERNNGTLGSKEIWRGSVMIVTEDAASEYPIPPTLRMFAQPMDLHQPTQSLGQEIPPEDEDPLAGQVKVSPHRLHAERGLTFWRFNIEVELGPRQTRIAYRINRGPATGFWVPASGETMNIMFHSCNGFSLSVEPDNFSGPDPLWRDVLNRHQRRPFHVMLGGGDQIYNDAAMRDTVLFKEWLQIKNPERKYSVDFSEEMQEELEAFYLERYAMWFSQGLFGMANSQIPMVNIWDDHDIIDGFGSVMDPVKAIGRTGALGGFINKFDGGVEILDDLDDHWTAKHHKAERNWFIQELQELAAEKSVRVTILGGDVHLGAVGQFYSNKNLGIPKDQDHRYMPNVVSSAIVNTPPPVMMADVLNKRNKIHHLDPDTDEDMIPMFERDVDGSKRNNTHLLPRRNFCVIREYQPGHTPNPTPKPSQDFGERFEEGRGRSAQYPPSSMKRTMSLSGAPGRLVRRLSGSSRNKNPPLSLGQSTGNMRRASSQEGSLNGPGFLQRSSSMGATIDPNDPTFDPRSQFKRRPTNLSVKEARLAAAKGGLEGSTEGMDPSAIDLEGGLDVTLCMEIDQNDPAGKTEPYRLLVPALWYQGPGDPNTAPFRKPTIMDRLRGRPSVSQEQGGMQQPNDRDRSWSRSPERDSFSPGRRVTSMDAAPPHAQTGELADLQTTATGMGTDRRASQPQARSDNLRDPRVQPTDLYKQGLDGGPPPIGNDASAPPGPRKLQRNNSMPASGYRRPSFSGGRLGSLFGRGKRKEKENENYRDEYFNHNTPPPAAGAKTDRTSTDYYDDESVPFSDEEGYDERPLPQPQPQPRIVVNGQDAAAIPARRPSKAERTLGLEPGEEQRRSL